MSAEIYSAPETTLVEPLMPEAEAERSDWAERIIAIVATAVGVMIIAAVTVIMGVA